MVCPSCNELFKNPKYLPCHHSYCEECLEKMQEHSKITCLKCANTTNVPIGGVNDLSNNYFMDNLVNKLILSHKLENEKELRCEECDEDGHAAVFCTDCKLFLCCYCRESHKYSKSHCSHNLMSLTEMRSNKDLIQSICEFPTCQEHDLELEYYCESCEKLVCVQCIVSGKHETHIYDVVKKFANKCRSEIKEVTVKLEKINEDLFKCCKSIGEVKATMKQQCEEIFKEIDLCYDEVIEKLLEQKEQVKEHVYDTVLEKEKAMARQLEEAIHAKEEILNIKRIEDAIKSDQEILCGSDHLSYSLIELTEKCDRLGQKSKESANIKITPNNKPLPQFVDHFATIDSLSFELKGLNSPILQG